MKNLIHDVSLKLKSVSLLLNRFYLNRITNDFSLSQNVLQILQFSDSVLQIYIGSLGLQVPVAVVKFLDLSAIHCYLLVIAFLCLQEF